MVGTLHEIGEVYFRLLGTNGFQVKVESERFTAAGSHRPQNLTSSFGRLTASKNLTKKRAARAARLFFLIQPIKSMICGVVVAVGVVKLPNRELKI